MATNEIFRASTLAAKFDKPVADVIELLAEAGIEPEQIFGSSYYTLAALDFLAGELADRELHGVEPKSELHAVPPVEPEDQE